MRIVLDPGHGGRDSGAVGTAKKLRESDVVLWFSGILRDVLEFVGHEVTTMRNSDSFESLWSRVVATNSIRPDLFLSIHANSANNAAARGFEVWTTHGATAADKFATAIFEGLAEHGYAGRPDYDDGDPDRETQFYVLRKTVCPAVLVELGFLSNVGDEKMLQDPAKLLGMACAIARALPKQA